MKIDAEPSKQNAFGLCDAVDQIIHVDKGTSATRQRQTFCHELIEAVNVEYDIGLEHHQIELLELALYQIATDNPEVFEVKE